MEKPYPAPLENPDRIYYATEPRNATLGELWRMAPPTIEGKLGALLVKLFRLAGPPQIGIAFDDVIRCSPDDVAELQAAFHDTIPVLAQLGFSPALAMQFSVIGDGHCSALAFLGNDPTVYAIIVYSGARATGREDTEAGLSFISRDATTIWATSNMLQTLDTPPIFNTQHLPGSSPERLHTVHCEKIKVVSAKDLRRFDTDELWSTLRENEALITRFNLGRGVFRPMTVSEIAAASKIETA